MFQRQQVEAESGAIGRLRPVQARCRDHHGRNTCTRARASSSSETTVTGVPVWGCRPIDLELKYLPAACRADQGDRRSRGDVARDGHSVLNWGHESLSRRHRAPALRPFARCVGPGPFSALRRARAPASRSARSRRISTKWRWAPPSAPLLAVGLTFMEMKQRLAAELMKPSPDFSVSRRRRRSRVRPEPSSLRGGRARMEEALHASRRQAGGRREAIPPRQSRPDRRGPVHRGSAPEAAAGQPAQG